MIAVFLLAVLYEGLKTLREYLVFMDWRHSHQHKAKGAPRCSTRESDSEEEEEEGEGGRRGERQSFILAKKRRTRTSSSRRKGWVE